MVVTAQPLATLAGSRILERGGNAADAAVAAAFAIAVVEPSMNSIGGRNQILIRLPGGRVLGIDGTTQVPGGYDPARATRAASGYATVAVPGALAGLIRLHREHGALRQAGALEDLAKSEGARAYFLKPDGGTHLAGERLIQADLARTLRAIAAGGAQTFYQGEIAVRIAADMEVNGGLVTRESLAAYEALSARVVRGDYRGYEIVGLDVPASGAIAIQALQIAEHFDPDTLGAETWAAVLAQAVGLAASDRSSLGTDTAAARVTSKAWAEGKAGRVRVRSPEEGRDSAAAGRTLAGAGDWLGRDGHTTHLSTADADGMMVALTQTIGPAMGARVATPGLGFLYAVSLGGYLGRIQPGERVSSSITPLFVSRDGVPVMILGAAGGGRIISAVVQTVSRMVDDGMSLPGALSAPRVHPSGGGGSGNVEGFSVEATPDDGWDEEELAAFRALGFSVQALGRRGEFGRVHAIAFDPVPGVWLGVADPDWEGSAQGPAIRP
jgi:gamma-glutamyltranspeptidase/glutathione hydrolase